MSRAALLALVADSPRAGEARRRADEKGTWRAWSWLLVDLAGSGDAGALARAVDGLDQEDRMYLATLTFRKGLTFRKPPADGFGMHWKGPPARAAAIRALLAATDADPRLLLRFCRKLFSDWNDHGSDICGYMSVSWRRALSTRPALTRVLVQSGILYRLDDAEFGRAVVRCAIELFDDDEALSVAPLLAYDGLNASSAREEALWVLEEASYFAREYTAAQAAAEAALARGGAPPPGAA